MLLLAFIFYLLRRHGTVAAPVANTTACEKLTNTTALHNHIATGWVQGPKQRGIWQILYSCLFTLLLCVYTSIHLNVPAKHDTTLRVWLRKTKWAMVAIFAPELVVFTAYQQWVFANMFLKNLLEIIKRSSDEKMKDWLVGGNGKSKPDMKYAHFVLMGGFAAKTDQIHNILKRVTLTTDAVLFLAQKDFPCCIDRGEIEDKSKADVLAKSLVCLQVVWIVGQAIERTIAKLSITILEIHTIVHVVCALTMYALWFQKPLDVHSPTIVELRDNDDLLAFMIECTNPEPFNLPTMTYKYSHGIFGAEGFNPWVSWIAKTASSPTTSTLVPYLLVAPNENQRSAATSNDLHRVRQHPVDIIELFAENSRRLGFLSEPMEYLTVKGESVCTIETGQSFGNNIGFLVIEKYWNISTQRIRSYVESCKISLTQADVRRLGLVETAWKRMGLSQTSIYMLNYDTGDGSSIWMPQRELTTYRTYLSHRNPNILFDILVRCATRTRYLVSAIVIIPTAYGCVHVGALSMIFPTTAESLLWKISCYYLIAVAGLVGAVLTLIYLYRLIPGRFRLRTPRRGRAQHPSLQQEKTYFMMFLGGFVLFLGPLSMLLYVFCRIYLVVESFISLRHVPIGVYQLPDLNIMGNIPHL